MKKLFLFGMLLIASTLIFTNCEREDSIILESEEQFSKSGYIDFSKYQTQQTSLGQLYNLLNTINIDNPTLRSIDFGIETNFSSYNSRSTEQVVLEVDATNVFFSQYENRNFSTFTIIEPRLDTSFRNLVIENIDSDYPIAKIVTYYPESNWLNADHTQEAYEGEIEIEVFDGQWQSGERSTYCYIDSEPTWGCAWSHSSGHEPGYPGCHGGNYITGYVYTEDCYDLGDGGSGVGEPTGGGTGQGNDNSSNDLPIDGILTKPSLGLNVEAVLSDCLGYNNSMYYDVNLLSSIETMSLDIRTAMANYLEVNGCNQESTNVLREIDVFLNENNHSPEAQAFALEAINDVNLNIEDYFSPYSIPSIEYFSVNLLSNICVKNMVRYDFVGDGNFPVNAGLINQIRNTFGDNANVDLVFGENPNLPEGALASTDFDLQTNIDSGEYDIVINLSEGYLNGNPTKLSIASVLIHEMVHAKLMYSYLQGNLLEFYPQYTDLNDKFQNFLDNRTDENAQSLEDAMHIAMIDFIGTMSYSLYKYAQHVGMDNITQDYCKEIIKGGFNGTLAMNLIDTGEFTIEELITKFTNEANNTDDAQGDDC